MTETILPHELPDALDHAPEGVRVLSLDCFDTLLWRDSHAPVDVFASLPGLLIGQRAGGEANARKMMRTLKRRNEVSLADIYAHVLPNADPADRDAAIAAELAAEARACFAFAPTVDLMRAAKSRGLSIMVVSDTYLTADQLRALIAEAAGTDVADLIDRVISSCDAGISKGEGLLSKALKAMKVRAHEVLHIGDNKAADYTSARALRIPALHLLQFSEQARQRFRFERNCAQMDPAQLGTPDGDIVGLQPHRALIALGEPQIEDPSQALGYTVLGPVFYAYDQWLREEAATLEKERGGQVHWLFMLRDGHLPDLIHATGPRAQSSGRVEISRFVATAASLTSREAYDRHIALEHDLNPPTLARQMLLNDEEIDQIVGAPKTDAQASEASADLLRELRRGQRQKITARRARDMAAGLIAHVRKAVDPKPGDTLMLVDLGYNGSAQNAVDAILSEAFGVHVAGRYLLCRERSFSGLDKTGLIDARHFDPGLLEAMCRNVAVIEQLATCDLGSVVGYEENGTPLRKGTDMKGSQSAVRDKVQSGVTRFAREARTNPVIRQHDAYASRAWREGAAHALLRFMFLPSVAELDVLKSFEHDVNLGSERMVQLFDTQDASEQMRRRGLFYMKNSSRMFLPADLAREDMGTRLSLLAQNRFALGFTYADYSIRSLSIPVFHIGKGQEAISVIEAQPTHDGFYVIRIPLTAHSDAIAIQIGAVCEWVEIDGITRSSVSALTGSAQDEAALACADVRPDAMTEHSPGMYECDGTNALMFVEPGENVAASASAQMVEMVFRPTRLRASHAESLLDTSASTRTEEAAKATC